jgi:hypothetical protein
MRIRAGIHLPASDRRTLTWGRDRKYHADAMPIPLSVGRFVPERLFQEDVMSYRLIAMLAFLTLGSAAQEAQLVKNPALDPDSKPLFALGKETLSIGGALAEGPAAFGRAGAFL